MAQFQSDQTDTLASRCAMLHALVRALPRHRFPVSDDGIPANGVYFIFETGEAGHDSDRIVRIGSHTGIGNLGARLREHVTLNKNRSIFRKHIGRALLNQARDPYLRVWNLDSTSRKDKDKNSSQIDVPKQEEVEAAVLSVITGTFTVVVLGATDHIRACEIEKLCIATVAGCDVCGPSKEWLGSHSTNSKIRESGLWQVQHLRGKGLSASDLRQLGSLI